MPGPANTCPRPRARAHYRPRDRARLGRRAANRAHFALPLPPRAIASGLRPSGAPPRTTAKRNTTGSRPSAGKQLLAQTRRWDQVVRAIGRILKLPATGNDEMSLLRYWRRSKWDRERLAEIESFPRPHRDRRQHRARHASRPRLATLPKASSETSRSFGEDLQHELDRAFLDTLGRNIRYAARALRHKPGFTAVAGADAGPRHRSEHRPDF